MPDARSIRENTRASSELPSSTDEAPKPETRKPQAIARRVLDAMINIQMIGNHMAARHIGLSLESRAGKRKTMNPKVRTELIVEAYRYIRGRCVRGQMAEDESHGIQRTDGAGQRCRWQRTVGATRGMSAYRPGGGQIRSEGRVALDSSSSVVRPLSDFRHLTCSLHCGAEEVFGFLKEASNLIGHVFDSLVGHLRIDR